MWCIWWISAMKTYYNIVDWTCKEEIEEYDKRQMAGKGEKIKEIIERWKTKNYKRKKEKINLTYGLENSM